MPVQSQKQRAFLNWKFGHAWVKRHHFDQKGKLPLYASATVKHMQKRRK
jgi:hypothetical protein